ncbi:MAG TPA: two-component system sensor histidine kinase CreC, partial [Gammaproteobacteria bacterium]
YALRKTEPSLRVYVTDATGKVVYDSTGQALGADYSRWNDVFLTLRGEYGARATREDPEDEFSTIYYVAAPVRHAGELVGVVSVGKPNRSLLPYLKASEKRIRIAAVLLLIAALVLGALFAAWMTRSVRRLTAYANAVSSGEAASPPKLRERELAALGNAMARMREELEGREYVENTVHALTHELKSPLAAIHGAVELLEENPANGARNRFLANIRDESTRMQHIVERMLQLAGVERRNVLESPRHLGLADAAQAAVRARRHQLDARDLAASLSQSGDVIVSGDAFLLEQAIGNLLDNAIDFSAKGDAIRIDVARDGESAVLRVVDQGEGIPVYARSRVFERFYSLPRPETQRRSTGLGLSFVREVARLHGGDIHLADNPGGGTVAELRLPLA